MDSLTRSPAKLLKEKYSKSLELLSPLRSRELLLAKERKLAALNLSIRKKMSPRDYALQSTDLAPSFKLFNNEEIFSLAEKSINVICNLPSPITLRKRKFSTIINEERENYEPVDMTVDLCSQFLLEDNSEIDPKRARISSVSI